MFMRDFNGGVVRQKTIPGDQLRWQVEHALVKKEAFSDHKLSGQTRQEYLARRYDLVVKAISSEPDFDEQTIPEDETCLEVGQKRFSVSDEVGQYKWLATRGVGPCCAVILHAEQTDTALATTCMAHLDAQTKIPPTFTDMLSKFEPSQAVKATLVGQETDIGLLADIVEELESKNIGVKAHIGVHSAVAVNVASGEIIASPKLPENTKSGIQINMGDAFAVAFKPGGKEAAHIDMDDRGSVQYERGKGFTRVWPPLENPQP